MTNSLRLLAILPWGILVFYLLRGRGDNTRVPFLALWLGPEYLPKVMRTLRPPPVPVTLVLAAILLGIFCAAGPRLGRSAAGPRVTVILDRGITLSSLPRRDALIAQADEAIRHTYGDEGEVDLVTVPNGAHEDSLRSLWATVARQSQPTALDTTAMLDLAAQAALRETDGPVIVLTDRTLHIKNARLIQATPPLLQNVALSRVVARTQPAGQIMVTLRNDSSRTSATVLIDDGVATTKHDIDLPSAGDEDNFFFPTANPKFIHASLAEPDDIAADNDAWCIRADAWPSVALHSGVSVDVGRVSQAYSRARPPAEGSARVAIVGNESDAPTDSPFICASEIGEPESVGAGPNLTIHKHAITDNVNWSALRLVKCYPNPPGDDWQPLVTAEQHVLSAIKPGPPLRRWVGFTAHDLAKSPDFVMLWTNLLDWTGAGGERYSSEITHSLGPGWTIAAGAASNLPAGWWPGIYRNADQSIAINAPPTKDLVSTADWRHKLYANRSHPVPAISLAPWLLAAALACILAAAALLARNQNVGADLRVRPHFLQMA